MDEYQVTAVKEHLETLYSKVGWHCDEIKKILDQIQQHHEYLERVIADR